MLEKLLLTTGDHLKILDYQIIKINKIIEPYSSRQVLNSLQTVTSLQNTL